MSFLLSPGQQSCSLIKLKRALVRERVMLKEGGVGSVVERSAVRMGFVGGSLKVNVV